MDVKKQKGEGAVCSVISIKLAGATATIEMVFFRKLVDLCIIDLYIEGQRSKHSKCLLSQSARVTKKW